MLVISHRRRAINVVFTTILMLALLVAQWVGLGHRIAHAGWQQGGYYSTITSSASADISSAPADNGGGPYHSCAAFDAATLASAIHTPPFLAPILPNVHVLALWLAFVSWQAPFTSHFSSRAPPLI